MQSPFSLQDTSQRPPEPRRCQLRLRSPAQCSPGREDSHSFNRGFAAGLCQEHPAACKESCWPPVWRESRAGWAEAGTRDLWLEGAGCSYSAEALRARPFSLLLSAVEGCSLLSRVLLGFCSLSVCLLKVSLQSFIFFFQRHSSPSSPLPLIHPYYTRESLFK